MIFPIILFGKWPGLVLTDREHGNLDIGSSIKDLYGIELDFYRTYMSKNVNADIKIFVREIACSSNWRKLSFFLQILKKKVRFKEQFR